MAGDGASEDADIELMVTLDGPAAAWLCARGVSRNVPPERAVGDILGEVLNSLGADEAWLRQNERRQDLIRKKFDGRADARG